MYADLTANGLNAGAVLVEVLAHYRYCYYRSVKSSCTPPIIIIYTIRSYIRDTILFDDRVNIKIVRPHNTRDSQFILYANIMLHSRNAICLHGV